jgi:hypothetical protein
LVNGELKSGNRLVQSFRSEAIVPRNIGPIPCSLVFTPGKSFVFGIYDTRVEAVNWNTGLGFSMLGQTEQRPSKHLGPVIPANPGTQPPAQAGRRPPVARGPRTVHSYNARLSVPGKPAAADEGLAQLNITGTEFELSDPDDPASAGFITGKCTGQGIKDARMHSRDLNTEVSIRRQ